MRYVTTCAISYKGDRVDRGREIEMSPEEAANYSGDLTPIGCAVKAAPELVPEVPVEEMSHAQLKDKAVELGLKKSGSVADLKERITLHLEGMIDHEVTEEDVFNHPDLIPDGAKVGDVIIIPADSALLKDDNQN